MNDRSRSRAPMLNRRTMLSSGLIGTVALSTGLFSDSGEVTQGPGTARPLADQANVSVERVRSNFRNRDVDLVTMYPKDVPPHDLPVCLMLHGRYGDARRSAAGLPTWLTDAVTQEQIRPFAFLAVDGGGNSYWHPRPGDDPMGMLLDEVPRWLDERGLGGDGGQPFAVSGISMGGFGALVYARHRRERGLPLEAATVVSPALITNWREMRRRKAFTNETEWAAIDPLRHLSSLGNVPLGVWCGTSDRFIQGTRRFIQLANPQVASTTPGGHNSRFYRKALPEVVRFVGRRVPEPLDVQVARRTQR